MKKLILATSIISLFTLPCYAEFTVSDTVSPTYLDNHGYSQATIQAVQKTKAMTNGEPLSEPVEKEYYNNPVVKFVRRFVMYIDPALDDHSFVNDHDIHPGPHFEDL